MDYTDSTSDDEPFDKVSAWFIRPIRMLRDLRAEDADGAFLALSASMAMYERFLIKVAQSKNLHPTNDRARLGGEDLGIGEECFRSFWSCFRDGLQHQFQPTKKRDGKTYYWSISKNHLDVPDVTNHEDKTVTIKINPWGFAEIVNSRYENNPHLFEQAKSHKAGEIQSLATNPPPDQENPTFAYHNPPDHPPSQSHNNLMQEYQTKTLETGVFRPTHK